VEQYQTKLSSEDRAVSEVLSTALDYQQYARRKFAGVSRGCPHSFGVCRRRLEPAASILLCLHFHGFRPERDCLETGCLRFTKLGSPVRPSFCTKLWTHLASCRLRASDTRLMVPPVEGCRPVRSCLRSRALDLRNCCIGPQSRPLAADCASNCRAAGDVESETRVPVLGQGPPDATIEAEVPM
jgi:hypothetical protein